MSTINETVEDRVTIFINALFMNAFIFTNCSYQSVGNFLTSSLLFLVIDTHVIKSQVLAFTFCFRAGQDSSALEPEKKV